MTELLVLCTGNAARSVMVGFMLDRLKVGRPMDGLHVVTAGTHSVDGQPMGARTRAALSSIPELAGAAFGRHRSCQVHESDLVRAELVVVMEADHVRFIRRQFPQAADRSATIKRVCRTLPPGPTSLGQRVSALELADAPLMVDEDVVDPAGGDDDAYVACAAQLWLLCQQLIDSL